MEGKSTRWWFHFMVGVTLATGLPIVGALVTESLDRGPRWLPLMWGALLLALNALNLRWQLRTQEERPEAIKERISQLEPELRKQVQARSYGARRTLIEAPLRELDLAVTPLEGWVRDPQLSGLAPVSENIEDPIVAAFLSSRRRMLIVGDPGSGKTMAAYSLIKHLDTTEGAKGRIPLLVDLSAWEAQDDFESFLVDYLCSEAVGYGVSERALAVRFVKDRRPCRYHLILDGLDELPAGLSKHFSARFDEFIPGLPDDVAVVVTGRSQEYGELKKTYPKGEGLALVQAVEIQPLTDEQLDSAFAELAKRDKDWETFLSQRDLTAYKRVRQLMSNPLFLNLAVVGHLSPGQLLDWSTTEHELRALVLERYLDRTLADQRDYEPEDARYEPEDARRYLTWIAQFLNGDEVSPFGLKTSDYTVFDLADLTPPEPPRRFRLFEGLVLALVLALVLVLVLGLLYGMLYGLVFGLLFGMVFGLLFGLVLALPTGWLVKRSAVSSRLTLAWPSTRRRLLDFLRRAGRGLVFGLIFGLVLGLLFGLVQGLIWVLVFGLGFGTVSQLDLAQVLALVFALVFGLGFGLLETRSVLITSRTPMEARSRSLIAALTWLVSGLVGGLGFGLIWALPSTVLGTRPMLYALGYGLGFGLVAGLDLALRNGGWFVVLQNVAHRRLARAGNLPSPPYDFLKWGIDRQVFRRVGGGVRFRHSLIQQHLAKSQQRQPREAETIGAKLLALAGIFLAFTGLDWLPVGLVGAFRDLLTLVVIMMVASGVVYLFHIMRHQRVSFREAIFNWPMVWVAGVVALLLFLRYFW